MDQAQWAQTEIALLPTEQIALRPSVQQKSLSHMPLELSLIHISEPTRH